MTATTILSADVAARIESEFPFEVHKFPLTGPDNMPTPHYGLFRSDDGRSVGVACRRGYVPHTRDDVQALAEAATIGMDSSGMVVSCLWDDGHNLSIGPTDSYRRSVYGSKDNIFPRFLIRFGYNGSACMASLGLFRDACQNLAMLRPAGASFSRKIRHTASLRDKMPELISDFRSLAGQWDRVADLAAGMESRQVVLADYLAQVYPAQPDATERTIRAHEKRISAIVRRIQRERIATGRPSGSLSLATAWEAYNGVQGYVQHEKSRHGRPARMARAWKALHESEVERAMTLAIAG